jgi:hypothetical protein
VRSSADIRASKVIFFSENSPQALMSYDQSISAASLIYHGLEQDTTQQVFWNETPSVSEGEAIYVFALWGGVDAALKYVASIADKKPQVLVIDDKEHNLTYLQDKGVTFELEFKQKQPKLISFMGKSTEKESSFFEALFLIADDQQVFVFQRMLNFLEERYLEFKQVNSKLKWHYQTTYLNATESLRNESLRKTEVPYDDISIKRLFCYHYDSDLAESAKQGNISRKVKLPEQSFFKQNAPAILGGVALGVVMGCGIAFGLDLGLMLFLLAAITVTATYMQYQSGASTKAPHS